MADSNATRAVTNTLSTTTADTISLSGVEEFVEVVNHDTTVTLYFTYEWSGLRNNAIPTTAVSAADEALAVLAGESLIFPARSEAIELSVVGNGNVYTVQSY